MFISYRISHFQIPFAHSENSHLLMTFNSLLVRANFLERQGSGSSSFSNLLPGGDSPVPFTKESEELLISGKKSLQSLPFRGPISKYGSPTRTSFVEFEDQKALNSIFIEDSKEVSDSKFENLSPQTQMPRGLPNVRSRNILRFIFSLFVSTSSDQPKLQSPKVSQVLFGNFPITNTSQLGNFPSKGFSARLRKNFPFSSKLFRSNDREFPLPLQIFCFSLPCVLFFGISQSINYVNSLESSRHFREVGVISETGLLQRPTPDAHKLLGSNIVSRGPLYGNFGAQPKMGIPFWKQDSPQLQEIEENLFRLPEYASKIFLIWALLYVWKGVRPQRKLSKDVRDLGFTRIVWPAAPSGGLRRFLQSSQGDQSRDWENSQNTQISLSKKSLFSKLQGLQAFFPLFQTLLLSLEFSVARTKFWSWGKGTFQQPTGVFSKIPEIRGNSSLNSSEISSNKGATSETSFPKGYLFVGPPGTGKTLLAQAIAHEAKLPLLCVSASEIQKQIEIGTQIGAFRVRKLFEQARRMAPCILFFDEIDAIGKSRGGGIAGETQNSSPGNLQEELPDELFTRADQNTGASSSTDLKLFTEFLIQMDSFPGPGKAGGFVVVGTTNYLNQLDSAFIRSGRFDRIVGLNLPSHKVRIDILKSYFSTSEIAKVQAPQNGFPSGGARETSSVQSELPWQYFGYFTEGWSPADLARMVNEAALYNLSTQLNKTTRERISGKEKLVSFRSLQVGLNRIHSHRFYLGKKDSRPGRISSQ